MEDLAVSRTALATSLMRAAHTRLDPNPLINDPWGDRLIPESARDMFRKDLNGSEMAAKYARLGESGLGQSAFSHIALARVQKIRL
jgi:O-methyltransferase involved in polyketide biosynthesis